MGVADAGYHVDSTSLEEEGFGSGDEIMGSFARHLMVHVDAWAERGFDPVATAYLERLDRAKAGDRRGIDINGDLLIHHHGVKGPPRRMPLLPALNEPSWLDRATGGVRL
jgi:hypothetical protein